MNILRYLQPGEWTLPLLLLILLLGLFAYFRTCRIYFKYSKIRSRKRVAGREAAECIMEQAGIKSVQIIATSEPLNDHYDPQTRHLYLSEENYRGSNLAAIGIAAHQAAHVLQHMSRYPMLKFRLSLLRAANGFYLALPVFLGLGMLLFRLGGDILISAVTLAYSALILLQFCTLHVEVNAVRKARKALSRSAFVGKEEMEGVAKILRLTAWIPLAGIIKKPFEFLKMLDIKQEYNT